MKTKIENDMLGVTLKRFCAVGVPDSGDPHGQELFSGVQARIHRCNPVGRSAAHVEKTTISSARASRRI